MLDKWNPPTDAIFPMSLERGRSGKRIWRCSRCRCEGFWSEGWLHYSSLCDLDDGFVRKVFCPSCAKESGFDKVATE